ncbi:Crp/Fnr family transcriptional regulator [Pedobacter sp. KBW06]|uniref:Crp/Fnr family transcriptional regulator n=1 Tax=Pedobacter sp. KBW06 TaxID=2153359 RepID=UPI000F595325|nr:cyclic nucleotide-binding domain-containing protein [Pedobacter sp. KBW06]
MKKIEWSIQIDTLLEYLNLMVPISPSFRREIRSMLTQHSFIGKHLLVNPGTYVNRAWFNVDGFVIASLVEENGTERVIRIYQPWQIFTDMFSFLKSRPSTLKFSVITKCTLLVIQRSDYETLKIYPETQDLFSNIMWEEQKIEIFRTRLMTLTDQSKVIEFASVYPINKLPNKVCASFLKMTESRFSIAKAKFNRMKDINSK